MPGEVNILLNKIVINEITVEIRGKEYQEITYEDGEIVLKTFNPKYKMRVSLRFSKEDDTEVIKKIRDIILEKIACIKDQKEKYLLDCEPYKSFYLKTFYHRNE